MPPHFLAQEREKYIYIFFEKLIPKKIQKSFIVNKNNEIISVWYLSSK